jgi:hypothetical protein
MAQHPEDSGGVQLPSLPKGQSPLRKTLAQPNPPPHDKNPKASAFGFFISHPTPVSAASVRFGSVGRFAPPPVGAHSICARKDCPAKATIQFFYKAADRAAFWIDSDYRKPNTDLLKTKKKPPSWLLFYIIKINTFFICVVDFSSFICYN